MMNRRSFLIGGATAAPVLLGTRYLSADPLGLPIGCQTYPVRKSINTDFAGTMKGLRAAGFTQIELCSPYGYDDFSSLRQYKPQELRRMLNDWGLGCISAHWAADELFKTPDKSVNCYSCHASHGDVDTTFVQFYPTLLPIAKSQGTLAAAYQKEIGMPAQR